MKRLLPLAILMSVTLFFPVPGGSFATEEKQEELTALEWKQVDGAWKTDLGKGLPEVLILKLSNADFHKYFANKKSAMNYHELSR